MDECIITLNPFFFQAEDGIRDFHVTGVQTCALPIFSAKAQELMARHSVDEALLAAAAPSPEAPVGCRIGVEAPYEQTKAVLLDAVASANHCRAVWNEALGFSTVVGFASDLEAVELLYTSLLVQATTAMTKAEAAQRAGGRKRTK